MSDQDSNHSHSLTVSERSFLTPMTDNPALGQLIDQNCSLRMLAARPNAYLTTLK